MKPEDIKVGSIWVYGPNNKIKIKVTDVDPYLRVTMEFIEHPFQLALNDTDIWEAYQFLQWYNPVYMVEGFEV